MATTTLPLQGLTETQLHYHPHIPSTLLSGSSDGLVNIYNTSLSDEDDAVIQVFNHGASVHHANFLSNDVVYAISNDEQLSFYMVANSENEFTHESGGEDEVPESWAFGDVRPALDCEYVVDLASKPEGLVIYAGSTRWATIPWSHLLDMHHPDHLVESVVWMSFQSSRPLPGISGMTMEQD